MAETPGRDADRDAKQEDFGQNDVKVSTIANMGQALADEVSQNSRTENCELRQSVISD
jgi:hypothetical protein